MRTPKTLSLSLTPPANISMTSHPVRFFVNMHLLKMDSVCTA